MTHNHCPTVDIVVKIDLIKKFLNDTKSRSKMKKKDKMLS